MAADADLERVLWAKYLDWCSARLVERFLQLTPDQIYELAQQAEAEPELGVGGEAAQAVGTEVAHRSVVARVTEALQARMQLPSFAEWSAAYAEAPERFEEELLGLWREQT